MASRKRAPRPPVPVPKGGRARRVLRPLRELDVAERAALGAHLQAYMKAVYDGKDGHKGKGRANRVVSSEELAEVALVQLGVKMSARSACRMLHSKVAIVGKMRQAKSRRMARAAQRYMRDCELRGVASGFLAGVDGPDRF
jgi:hypothetical protein